MELYHYGVKGMKWGVRRNIATKARAAAQYKEFAVGAERNINRLERKKAKKGEGFSERDTIKLNKNKKLLKRYKNIREKLVKNLSQKDIARGERQIKMMPLLLGAPVSGIVRAGNLERARLVLEDEREARYAERVKKIMIKQGFDIRD